MTSLIDRLRTWRLAHRGLSRGEFDQLEQLRRRVPPGDLISPEENAGLKRRGLVAQDPVTMHWHLTKVGSELWAQVKSTPRRHGNWLAVL